MQVNDFVRCTYSEEPLYYTVGKIYQVADFDCDGDPILRDNEGWTSGVGCPLDGCVWKFEALQYDQQTIALLNLLEQSEQDVKAGRIMTREQLLNSLSKD